MLTEVQAMLSIYSASKRFDVCKRRGWRGPEQVGFSKPTIHVTRFQVQGVGWGIVMIHWDLRSLYVSVGGNTYAYGLFSTRPYNGADSL